MVINTDFNKKLDKASNLTKRDQLMFQLHSSTKRRVLYPLKLVRKTIKYRPNSFAQKVQRENKFNQPPFVLLQRRKVAFIHPPIL